VIGGVAVRQRAARANLGGCIGRSNRGEPHGVTSPRCFKQLSRRRETAGLGICQLLGLRRPKRRSSGATRGNLLPVSHAREYPPRNQLAFTPTGGFAVDETPYEDSKAGESEPLPQEFRGGHLMFSPSAVVFTFTDEHRRQAAKCLRESGEIRISFRDISVTDLSHIGLLNGDGGVVVD
jgi:hypothetical protein